MQPLQAPMVSCRIMLSLSMESAVLESCLGQAFDVPRENQSSSSDRLNPSRVAAGPRPTLRMNHRLPPFQRHVAVRRRRRIGNARVSRQVRRSGVDRDILSRRSRKKRMPHIIVRDRHVTDGGQQIAAHSWLRQAMFLVRAYCMAGPSRERFGVAEIYHDRGGGPT